MKEELLKLAERVEALRGPDREVDSAIDSLTFRGPFEARLCGCIGKCLPGHPAYDGACVSVPHYTASLDAAMTLVPKTMSLVDLTLSWEPPEPEVFPACSITWYPAAVIHNGKDWHALTASGATPALALCAAALRALAKEK